MKPSVIRQILDTRGPLLSSNIIQLLREAGFSPTNARQRVSRRAEDIKSLQDLNFPKNARFLYLESQYNSIRYWESLVRALRESNSAYYRVISSLLGHGGAILRPFFDIISGSPIKQKKHLSSSIVLERLKSTGIIKVNNYSGVEVVQLNENIFNGPLDFSMVKARYLTEQFILDAIRKWAVRLNFVSSKAAKIRENDGLPLFGTFCFDMCGPSYLFPLKRFSKNKVDPGFLVVDVIYGNELTEENIDYFIHKCNTLSVLKNIPPFLPMLIGDYFTSEALKKCRSEGIVATTPGTLFGEDVAIALKELLRTLTNAAAVAAANPEKIECIFNRLSTIEGSAGNLRGALFELIVGYMVKSIEGGSIDIGAIVTDNTTNKSAEIDVRLVKERIVNIYECKGYQPNTAIGKDDIKHWLQDSVPTIYKAHIQENRFIGSDFRFEFWTCGYFNSDATALLDIAKANTKKYSISWKDKSDVSEYSKQIKAPGIRKIINEHYLNHPLTKI